jgi:hypothetical protein
MNSSLTDKKDEDEIKRYSADKDGHFTIIAVFEGDTNTTKFHKCFDSEGSEIWQQIVVLQVLTFTKNYGKK